MPRAVADTITTRLSSLTHPFRQARCVHSHFRATDVFTPEQIRAAGEDAEFPITVSEDGTHALRERRAEGRKPLPLPPHMDPVRRAQRNKWKSLKAKPLEREEMSESQKKLWDNPYARSLGTPTRYCAVTRARLPAFFLLPFGLQRDDATSTHSLVPKNLYDKSEGRNPARSRSRSVLAKAEMVDWLSEPRRKKVGRGAQLLMGRTSGWPDVGEVGWDMAMPHTIREGLRGVALRALKKGLELPDGEANAAILPYGDQSDGVGEVACLISLSGEDGHVADLGKAPQVPGISSEKDGEGTSEPSTSEISDGARRNDLVQPSPGYALTRIGKNIVPVYDLSILIGQQRLQAALKDTALEKATAAIVFRSPSTLSLEMALLKLRNYLSTQS